LNIFGFAEEREWDTESVGCTGSGHSKYLILNGIAAYFAFKSGLYRSFWGQKGRYRKNSESYNALFDAKKGDIGPENTCF